MASSWAQRFLCTVPLYLIIVCYCSNFASSFIATTFVCISKPNLLLSTKHTLICRAAAKQEVSEESEKELETKIGPEKKTVRKKKSSAVKAKATKAKKNGVKAESAKKGASKTKKKNEGPVYWRNETDYFVLLDRDFQNITCTADAHAIQFLVRGNPRPLSRHRTARGFMYNPSAKHQASFRKVVQEMVWTNDEESHPLFAEEDQLAMRLVFHMKRPKIHFVGGKPGPGRLRPVAPGRLAPTRTDVDNLAKFVLDLLNGLLYVDDRQVASIHATKIYDNDGCCQGRIQVSIQRLEEDDIDDLLSSSVMPQRPTSTQ